MNTFPYEILENIASNVSTHDQYNGLIVCKSWYLPFCRSLYRHVNFFSRHQFKKFIHSNSILHHGQLIRTIQIGVCSHKLFKAEDCVTGAIPLLPIQVGVTLHELLKLIHHIPLLQSFNFDHRLWHFMNTNKISFSNKISSLPPLDHPRQLRLLHGHMIQKLHLRGADMFQLHKEGKFLDALKGLSLVVDLTIDGDGMWDTEHVMHFTMNDMNTLHTYLPRLKRLNITDAVHFSGQRLISGNVIQLKEFQLFASVDCLDAWCSYFGSSYPLLSSLNIKLTSRHKQKLALTQWINKLPHLKTLNIHPSMAKHFMDEKTLASVKNIETLEIGLWGHDMETSTNALQWLTKSTLFQNTRHLVIPIWSSVMDLSAYTLLFQLELYCLQRDSQEYAIDTILDSCPVLNQLELNWGKTSCSIKPWIKHNHLKSLRMNHVSILDHNVFAYLSVRCPKLEGLFLRRCNGVTELNMLGSHFKYIVISEVLLQTKVMAYLKLIQFQKLEQHRKRRATKQVARFYKSYQDQYTFQTCIQRLKIEEEEEEEVISILCGSVEQLVFNGCRI